MAWDGHRKTWTGTGWGKPGVLFVVNITFIIGSVLRKTNEHNELYQSALTTLCDFPLDTRRREVHNIYSIPYIVPTLTTAREVVVLIVSLS